MGKDERIVFLLRGIWGLNGSEIADLFGVSVSRVSQWHKRIQERIQQRIKEEASGMAAKTKRAMQEIIQEKTKRKSELEQRQTKQMEKRKPGKMESFSAASF